jgi:hypothetical protein
MLKRFPAILCAFLVLTCSGFSQETGSQGGRILFRGLVKDASTLLPINNSQIIINGAASYLSSEKGAFAIYVSHNDTVMFKSLGYKPITLNVSDTLKGREFVTGVYMNSDTLSIGEVIIISKFTNIKSEILNAKNKTPSIFDNAKYNVAISAYQGKNSQGSLGTPSDNYSLLTQRQKINAYEKGGIPSDRMIGLNPLLIAPAVYLLIKGVPEKPAPFVPDLTDQEVNQLQKRYLESIANRK